MELGEPQGTTLVSAEAGAEIRRMAAEAYPQEGCGVLIGHNRGGRFEITGATQGTNLVTDRAHDRYRLDPGDFVAAENAAREQGLEVVGFWHSHPDHSALPSQFDTDHAWTDYVYVICATTRHGAADMGAYTLTAEGGPFGGLSIEIGPAAA